MPFASSRIISDAEIALAGALGNPGGGNPGGGDECEAALALIGTGSVYIARCQGVSRRLGGWGFMGGDQSSGARIGFELMRESLLAHDGVIAPSALTRAILDEFDNSAPPLAQLAARATPQEFARYAPRVFYAAKERDPVALSIIGRAVDHLEASLATLCPQRAHALYLLGGLAPHYAPLLSPSWQTHLAEPVGDALAGAVLLARDDIDHSNS
ncbi:MAG: hypothetical protein OD811_03235 [Alphaproteobacteria bacterium]